MVLRLVIFLQPVMLKYKKKINKQNVKKYISNYFAIECKINKQTRKIINTIGMIDMFI